jgi:uncharacterized protein YprB with RNaseH-like and TPR domain
MARAPEVYLDLETDPDDPWGHITILGLYSRLSGYIQLVDDEVTTSRVRTLLPKEGHLFTFNGDQFDLPIIRRQLGINLWNRFTSRDLRRLCAEAGLVGGQKRIERRLGWRRPTAALSFFQQRNLWRRYEREGDAHACARLLTYNRHDLDGMRWIRTRLSCL